MGNDSDRDRSGDSVSGLLYGLAAYGLWGIMPLYFVAVREVSAGEILAQRIVWCGLLLIVILTLTGKWDELRARLRTPGVRRTFLLTALLLSVNWLVYIYGVTTRQTVETSLGYFINPLINVVLGVIVLHERLRPGQAAAVVLAALAVGSLVASSGQVPWIALTLGVSFAVYGLLRKRAPVDALLGLSIETFVLAPVALGYLAVLLHRGASAFGQVSRTVDLLLLASGVVTAVPLLCFGQAARQLRLSTLGVLQYLAPTVQFILAVVWLGETVAPEKVRAFVVIWAALAIYSLDSWRALATRRGTCVADCDGGAEVEPVSQTDSAG
jgi:chloramphenicol-sensitive protein RarD